MPSHLIHMLSDGAFHSGSELAVALGLSRTAVWKQVRRLADLGLNVQAVRGRGYRVPGGIDLLDPAVIRSRLPGYLLVQLDDLEIFDSVDSTNAVAMSRARAGHGNYACLAERQTAGRGRRGRAWVSPYAANIYLSISWEFLGGVGVTEGLSLAVGVAACEAVRSLGCVGAMLKWPNDLVVDGAKLGGILIELGGDLDGSCRAVIGIGLNVGMPALLSEAIDQQWVDLRGLGIGVSRNEVAVALLSHVLPSVALFAAEGLAPFQSRWDACDACRGREVLVLGAGEPVSGTAMGIDSAGALKISTEGGVRTFRGGEVSLRGWA